MRGSLSKQVAANSLGYPEIGQTHYIVDANYRTQAQGWWRADGTGPLDLYAEKNPGYVFRTDKYSTDRNCIQAAIDAAIDFRGDALFFTPGTYSIATTALSIDVPDLRLLGPKVSTPMQTRAILTDAIGSGFTTTAAADRLEVAYLQFIPLTATAIWSVVAGTNAGHFHDFYYNADGIAANAATQFMLAAGTTFNDWTFSDFVAQVDAAQGPLIELDGTGYRLLIKNFTFWVDTAAPLACALLDIDGDGVSVAIENGRGNITAGGSVTNLAQMADQTTNTTVFTVRDFRGQIGFCAAGGLIAQAGAAGEVNVVNSYLDVVSGGAGGIGTAFTA